MQAYAQKLRGGQLNTVQETKQKFCEKKKNRK